LRNEGRKANSKLHPDSFVPDFAPLADSRRSYGIFDMRDLRHAVPTPSSYGMPKADAAGVKERQTLSSK
jgi:hypothetical protein